MTRIDDVHAAAVPQDPSLDPLKTAILAWLDDLDGSPTRPELRLEPYRPLPTLDEHGLLRRGARWVSLTPTEERVMRALLGRAGRVCSRTLLVEAGWPRGLDNDRVLDTYVRRLRAKSSEFGLAIRTVRKRGFLLDFEGAVV